MTFSIKQCVIDQPRCTKRVIPAYLLASDGTNSAVWHTANLALSSPVWTKGAEIAGEYSELRITKTAGTILGLRPHGDTPWSHDLDFTTSDYGAQAVGNECSSGDFPINYVPGSGFQTTDDNSCGHWYRIAICSIPLSTSATITKAVMTYDAVKPTTGVISTPHGVEIRCAVNASLNMTNIVTGTGQTLTATAPTGTASSIFLELWVGKDDDHANLSGSGLIRAVHLEGTGDDPFGGTSTAVRESINFGATFSSAVAGPPAAPTGVSGFDVQRAGTVSVVGGKDAIYRATTLGGSYSSYHTFTGANIVAALIPDYRHNSRTQKQTTVSDPDIYLALDAPYFTGTLFYINGASGIAFNITPVAGITFDNPHCIWSYYGTVIEVWGKVSGVYKLYRTIDGGTTWVLIDTVTNPQFITGRRGDTRASKGGVAGQIYLVESDAVDYSSKLASNWTVGGTHFPRTMPAPGVKGVDILG